MRKALWSFFFLFSVGLSVAGSSADGTPVQSLDASYDAERREIAGTLVTSLPAESGSDSAAENTAYFLLLPNLDRERNPHLSAREIDSRYPYGFEESALDIDAVLLIDGDARRPAAYRLLSVAPGLQTYSLFDAALAVDVQTASAVEVRFTTRAPRVSTGDGGVTHETFTWRFGWFPLRIQSVPGLREQGATLFAGDSDAFPLVFPRTEIEARITVPEDVILTAGADKIERVDAAEDDDETATYAIRNVSPTRSLALSFAADLERYLLDGPTPIEVTFRKGHEDEARLLSTYARDILADYASRFGAYPRLILRIVEGASTDGDAMSADGIAILSSRFFTHRDILVPGVLHRLTEFVLAHEIAHQWFGMLGGIDLDRDGWLSEGLSQYASVGYFERRYGAADPNLLFVTGNGVLEDAVAKQFGYFNLREHLIELPYAREVWSGFDEALVKSAPEIRYGNASAVRLYDKGFIVARALAAAVGEEAFNRALARAVSETQAGRLDPAALQRVCEEEAGRSLEDWFQAWVYGDASVDYSAKILTRSQNDATYETTVLVRREGGVPQDVEVEARLVSDATTRLAWDAVEAEGTLVFRTPSPVVRVTIDPDHRLPDKNRLNNHSPARLVVAADEAAYPLDAYVLAPDTASSGVSISFLDRLRIGLSQGGATLTVRQGRGDEVAASVSFASPLTGSVTYSHTAYAPSETGAPGTSWEPSFTFSAAVRRVLSDALPLYVLHGSFADLAMTGESSQAGAAVDVGSTGAIRLSAAAAGEFGLLPQIYLEARGFVGFGLDELPTAMRFGFSDLHAVALPASDVKVSGSLALELPAMGRVPYNLFHLAMIDEASMRLFVAGGAGWKSSDRYSTTSAGAEAGMEQVFQLSTLGGFLPLTVRIGIAIPLQGALKPALYAGVSL